MKSNYKNFDNDTLNYNLNNFNLQEWITNVLTEKFSLTAMDELTDLHLYLTAHQVKDAQAELYKSFQTQEFRAMVDKFCIENITSIVQPTEYLVQAIPNLRIVLPDQESLHQKLQFHQGIWFGNGVGIRTIWIPVTKTLNTNSMYVVDLERSRYITQQTINKQLSYETFERLSLETARPVNLSPGQCHLFSQEHIHGNVDNIEKITRISIDMRILLKGEPCGRKLPGGYFRSINLDDNFVSQPQRDSNKNITYAGWNSKYTEEIPLHFQREMFTKYCKEKSIKVVENVMEFDTLNWCPCLYDFLKPGLDSVIVLSIYALPDDRKHRMSILEKVLNMGVTLHFVNEDIVLSSIKDIDLIENYLTYSPRTIFNE